MATTASTISAADALAAGWRVHQAGDLAAAETTYRRVIAAQPQNAAAWCYLGMVCHDQLRFDESEAAYRRALTIDPQFAIAWNNLGNTLQALLRLDESVQAYDQALRIKPDYANAHMNRGLALLMKGDFAEGFAEYEWRLHHKMAVRATHDAPRWDGSPLHGRTLLIEAEQGIGDTIQFIRYAAEIKRQHDCRVIAAVQPQLLPLLFGIEGVDGLVGQNRPRPPFDVWAQMLSLPGLMKHELSTFPWRGPYLKADPLRAAKWKSRLADLPGRRVGIAWQGQKANFTDRRRSFPLAALAPLARLEGVTLISLQMGDGAEQLAALKDFKVVWLGKDFDASGGAFTDTAAVMQHLDLVVSADTAVAHVAGALGVPVWLALSAAPDWRWTLTGETTPWYASMRLFRQTTIGDWSGVFTRMADALRRRTGFQTVE